MSLTSEEDPAELRKGAIGRAYSAFKGGAGNYLVMLVQLLWAFLTAVTIFGFVYLSIMVGTPLKDLIVSALRSSVEGVPKSQELQLGIAYLEVFLTLALIGFVFYVFIACLLADAARITSVLFSKGEDIAL